MTEPKSEIKQAASPVASEKKPAAAGTAASSPSKGSSTAKKGRSVLGAAFVIVLLLAAALGAALWYQHQVFKKTSDQLSSQAQSNASAAQQAGAQARQAAAMAQTQAAQIAALQRSLHDAQGQMQSLEQTFQALTDSGSDLVLINDVDHLVTIANQQLTLSGNVANAIIALETAQAQLARANRPHLASLQQTINGDLDRLRSVATIDVALLSSQLDELGKLVGRAPLLIPDDAAPGVAAADGRPSAATPAPQARPIDPDAPWWRRAIATAEHWSRTAWWSVRQDLGSVISVRRVSDSASLLMSPEQATQLRENLQLRIMTAQLALMTRQPKVWASETQTLLQALDTRYDTKTAQTQQALKLARHLADTSISVELPTVNNSLQAIEALRQANAQAAENKAMSPSPEDAASGIESANDDDLPAGGGANGASGDAVSPSVSPANAQPATPQE